MRAHNETGNYLDSIKATVRLALWTLAWLATLALARFGPGHLWDSQQSVASWAAVSANVVADKAGRVAYDVDVAVLPTLLGVVFMIAFAVGKIRYR